MIEPINTDATIAQLRWILHGELKKRSLRELSRQSGIPIQTLYNFTHGRHRPQQRTTERLISYLYDKKVDAAA